MNKRIFGEKFKCCMFFYDNKILNPKLAPDWLANIKVIKIMPNPGISGSGQL